MSVSTASVPVTIRGRYFWRGDERFFVRGVVYQVPDVQDPITDARLPQLKHDIALFKELKLNTIFVYFIDDTKRHGQAMRLLEEAGIYVFTGVSTRFNTINRLDPYKSYRPSAVTGFFQIVNTMAQYSNTLGLLVASNLVNNKNTEKAIPVAKAVVRDLKRYMELQNESHNQRVLLVGYDAATIDDRDTRILDYFSLGDPASSIDFWTCTCYSWAGHSNMLSSGYEELVTRLQSAAIPIFMSGYGTNLLQPRLFQETAALYSPRMSQVFSGGCAYEFWEGPNGYGLVELLGQEQARTAPARTAQQNDKRALARADDPKKTAEKRKTERGTLSIFHDFVNYKANLEATKDIEQVWEGDVMERKAAERRNIDTTQMSWPWEPKWKLPESCVDWAGLEASIKSGEVFYVQ